MSLSNLVVSTIDPRTTTQRRPYPRQSSGMGREATALASLRYGCVWNRFADAYRSVKADDMVMSSLPDADDVVGREGITIPSVGKGSRGTCAGCGRRIYVSWRTTTQRRPYPIQNCALGREAAASASLY